ncbi:5'/3'-nucleotidase SurE [Rhizomonospora bruguierae]|uniref:5'/3'-nucleotidase SurE n=1 Tax=Rhizomonospora bruguierae TaxID=1581705 RepID=UPI001BCAADAC|nr:5'/3'-nucleotidase SurE [Micromonospora sp. NBRC 107566]
MSRVLVTNDDGIDAPGLRRLAAAAVARGHDVVVAAPDEEASGSSAALTATQEKGRVVVHPRPLAGLPGVKGFAVASSPGFIALIAEHGAFGDPPEIVLSGINRGANAGRAVLHSGTVGATLTAAASGLRALAVSLDILTPGGLSAAVGTALAGEDDRNWVTAADLAGQLLDTLVGLPPATVLNLNVPDVPAEKVRGVRRAALATFGQVQMTIAEIGEGYIRTAIEETAVDLIPGTDLALLADGYATVTPLMAVGEAPLRLPEPYR